MSDSGNTPSVVPVTPPATEPDKKADNKVPASGPSSNQVLPSTMEELKKPRLGRKPKEPSLYELLDKAIAEGDVGRVIELCNPIDQRRLLGPCLRQAMDVLAQKDPAMLIEFLYRRILAFQGLQLIRSQIMAEDEIQYYESGKRNVGVPEKVATELLPRVAMLQSEVQKTSQALARTMHTMSLAAAGTKLDQKNLEKIVSIYEKQAAGDASDAGKETGVAAG